MRTMLFVLFTIGVTGCFKRYEGKVNTPCSDSCTTFNIRVTTGLHSATPLRDAKVELGWRRPATPFGDPGRLIAKGRTAADGTLQVSFKAEAKELEAGMFYVTVRNGNGYFFQENGYYGIRGFDTTVHANVHVPSKATLKLVFKNFYPSSTKDYFGASPGFSAYGSMGIPIDLQTADGQSSNSFFFGDHAPFSRMELTGTTAGDQFTYFSILIKKNGVRTDLRDSLYIAKGTTGTYEISF
jgi:hypothetical protein